VAAGKKVALSALFQRYLYFSILPIVINYNRSKYLRLANGVFRANINALYQILSAAKQNRNL